MRNKTWIRLLAGVFCAAFLIGALPMREARAETALASGFVNTAKLNLRKGAGTGNAILDTLKADTTVNIYEVIGTWLRIDVPSTGTADGVAIEGEALRVCRPYLVKQLVPGNNMTIVYNKANPTIFSVVENPV